MTIALVSGLGDVRGQSSSKETDPIRDALLKVMDLTLDPISASSSAAADVAADTTGDTAAWAVPQQAGIAGLDLMFGLPFGFEVAEFLAWYYAVGRDVQKAQFVAAGNKAQGSFDMLAIGSLVDGQLIVLDDGNSRVDFELDVAGNGVGSGNVAIDVSGDSTAEEVATTVAAAINGEAGLRLSASSSGATVTPKNHLEGTIGEVTTWSSTNTTINSSIVQPLVSAATALDIEPFLVRVGMAESGGWWKEAISARILDAGQYSAGANLRMRIFGIGRSILNAAFPNVITPAATVGQSALGDFQNNNFNAAEFAYPEADVFAGLFPNSTESPDIVARNGSIVAAGANNYYQSGWHQPITTFELWVNKTWFEALTPDGDKKREQLAICARNAVTTSIEQTRRDQAGLVGQFQDMGVTIHAGWPHNVLSRLRTAAPKVLDDVAATSDASFAAMLDSMRDFIAANQHTWNHSSGRRSDRWQWDGGWQSELTL